MGRVENESFIKIEGWMVNRFGLSGTDLVLYALIHGFSIKKEGPKLYPSFFWGSLDTMQKWSNSSRQTVIDSLLRLQGIDPNQKRKKSTQYLKLIIKETVPKGKNHLCKYYTIESRIIIEEHIKHLSENQTVHNNCSQNSRPMQSKIQTTDGLNYGLNNTINTDKNTTTVQEAVFLYNNKVIDAIKTVFLGENPFTEDFSNELTKNLMDSNIEEVFILDFIKFVYEKTILKNPNSIINYFYRIGSQNSLICDFKLQLDKENRKKTQLKKMNIICPVCSTKHSSEITCPICQLRNSDNQDEIAAKKAVYSLNDSQKKEIQNKLIQFGIDGSNPDFFYHNTVKKIEIYKEYLPDLPDELIRYCN